MAQGADVTITTPFLHSRHRVARRNPGYEVSRASDIYNGLDGLLVRTALVRSAGYKAAERRAGKLKTAADVAKLCRHLADADTEYKVVIAVDKQRRPRAIYEMTTGATGSVKFTIAQVAKIALLTSASGVFVVHNHPGGSTKPSRADLEATANTQRKLACVGVDLLDEIIVSHKGFYSFAASSKEPYWKERRAAAKKA